MTEYHNKTQVTALGTYTGKAKKVPRLLTRYALKHRVSFRIDEIPRTVKNPFIEDQFVRTRTKLKSPVIVRDPYQTYNTYGPQTDPFLSQPTPQGFDPTLAPYAYPPYGVPPLLAFDPNYAPFITVTPEGFEVQDPPDGGDLVQVSLPPWVWDDYVPDPFEDIYELQNSPSLVSVVCTSPWDNPTALEYPAIPETWEQDGVENGVENGVGNGVGSEDSDGLLFTITIEQGYDQFLIKWEMSDEITEEAIDPTQFTLYLSLSGTATYGTDYTLKLATSNINDGVKLNIVETGSEGEQTLVLFMPSFYIKQNKEEDDDMYGNATIIKLYAIPIQDTIEEDPETVTLTIIERPLIEEGDYAGQTLNGTEGNIDWHSYAPKPGNESATGLIVEKVGADNSPAVVSIVCTSPWESSIVFDYPAIPEIWQGDGSVEDGGTEEDNGLLFTITMTGGYDKFLIEGEGNEEAPSLTLSLSLSGTATYGIDYTLTLSTPDTEGGVSMSIEEGESGIQTIILSIPSSYIKQNKELDADDYAEETVIKLYAIPIVDTFSSLEEDETITLTAISNVPEESEGEEGGSEGVEGNGEEIVEELHPYVASPELSTATGLILENTPAVVSISVTSPYPMPTDGEGNALYQHPVIPEGYGEPLEYKFMVQWERFFAPTGQSSPYFPINFLIHGTATYGKGEEGETDTDYLIEDRDAVESEEPSELLPYWITTKLTTEQIEDVTSTQPSIENPQAVGNLYLPWAWIEPQLEVQSDGAVAGSVEVTIPVEVLSDELGDEELEEVVFTLSQGSYITPFQSQAIALIENEEGGGYPFVVLSVVVGEEDDKTVVAEGNGEVDTKETTVDVVYPLAIVNRGLDYIAVWQKGSSLFPESSAISFSNTLNETVTHSNVVIPSSSTYFSWVNKSLFMPVTHNSYAYYVYSPINTVFSYTLDNRLIRPWTVPAVWSKTTGHPTFTTTFSGSTAYYVSGFYYWTNAYGNFPVPIPSYSFGTLYFRNLVGLASSQCSVYPNWGGRRPWDGLNNPDWNYGMVWSYYGVEHVVSFSLYNAIFNPPPRRTCDQHMVWSLLYGRGSVGTTSCSHSVVDPDNGIDCTYSASVTYTPNGNAGAWGHAYDYSSTREESLSAPIPFLTLDYDGKVEHEGFSHLINNEWTLVGNDTATLTLADYSRTLTISLSGNGSRVSQWGVDYDKEADRYFMGRVTASESGTGEWLRVANAIGEWKPWTDGFGSTYDRWTYVGTASQDGEVSFTESYDSEVDSLILAGGGGGLYLKSRLKFTSGYQMTFGVNLNFEQVDRLSDDEDTPRPETIQSFLTGVWLYASSYWDVLNVESVFTSDMPAGIACLLTLSIASDYPFWQQTAPELSSRINNATNAFNPLPYRKYYVYLPEMENDIEVEDELAFVIKTNQVLNQAEIEVGNTVTYEKGIHYLGWTGVQSLNSWTGCEIELNKPSNGTSWQTDGYVFSGIVEEEHNIAGQTVCVVTQDDDGKGLCYEGVIVSYSYDYSNDVIDNWTQEFRTVTKVEIEVTVVYPPSEYISRVGRISETHIFNKNNCLYQVVEEAGGISGLDRVRSVYVEDGRLRVAFAKVTLPNPFNEGGIGDGLEEVEWQADVYEFNPDTKAFYRVGTESGLLSTLQASSRYISYHP